MGDSKALYDALSRQKFKTIITDMDGTFFGSGLSVPSKTIGTYRKAKERGLEIIPASGRSFTGVHSALEVNNCLDFRLYPGVYSNGAVVYGSSGKNDKLAEHLISSELLHKIAKYVEELNRENTLDANWKDDKRIIEAPPEHGFASVRNHALPPTYITLAGYSCGNLVAEEINQLNDGFDQFKDGPLVAVGPLEEFIKHNPINKLLVLLHSGWHADKYRAGFEALIGEDGVLTSGFCRTFEINPPGVNKAKAIELIAKHKGFKLKESIAIGDGSNDVDLLRASGLPLAMGNAAEAVKKEAAYITDDVDDNGWSNVFELIFKIQDELDNSRN